MGAVVKRLPFVLGNIAQTHAGQIKTDPRIAGLFYEEVRFGELGTSRTISYFGIKKAFQVRLGIDAKCAPGTRRGRALLRHEYLSTLRYGNSLDTV